MKYTLSNGKDRVYQWDHDIVITITEPEDVPEVHFRWGGQAVPLTVTNQQVEIPPELMQLPKDIVFWAYTPDHTMDMARIPLQRRPKPSDYVYTPTEIRTWEQLDERIKALENNSGSGSGGGSETITYDMSTVSWEPGTVNSRGANLSNNYRIRTAGVIKLPAGARITTGGQMNMDVAVYSSFTSTSLFVFVEKRGFSKEDYTTTTAAYFRIILYDDAGTRYADSTEYVSAAAGNVVITYKKEGSDNAQDNLFRVVLPYMGYVLNETTAEEAAAPAAGNLANLYAQWDALVTKYPANVSMEVLGTDSSGYEMRCYSITSNSDTFKWTLADPPKNPKILWISGIHGHESTIFVDDLKFFTELLAQKSEITAQLFCNCDFKVIPAACPWGYQNGSRTNANGVNINRNFPASWTLSGEGTNNYSGASALSEFESQTIAEFLGKNTDCILAINRHSSSEFAPTSVLGYFVSQFSADQAAAYSMCRFMSAQLKRSTLYQYITSAENSDAESRCLYTVEASTATGTLDKYFNSIGIHGYLYEASPVNKIAGDGENGYTEDWGRVVWQRINVTNIGNLLYAALLQNEYIR